MRFDQPQVQSELTPIQVKLQSASPKPNGLEACTESVAKIFVRSRRVDWRDATGSIHLENLILLHGHVERPDTGQRLAYTSTSQTVLPASRNRVRARLQILDDPIKAVSGNGAFIETEEASASNCQTLRRERLEKIGTDLNVAGVIGDPVARNHLRIARAGHGDLKVHACQRGTAYCASAAS